VLNEHREAGRVGAFPTVAIIGPHTFEHLRSSPSALELELSPDELRWLNLEDD
jgi:aryl-alcohol dehydrogenase-like predicted oxidoreductase